MLGNISALATQLRAAGYSVAARSLLAAIYRQGLPLERDDAAGERVLIRYAQGQGDTPNPRYRGVAAYRLSDDAPPRLIATEAEVHYHRPAPRRGRPRVADEPMQVITARVPCRIVAKLKEEQGSFSAAVREALERGVKA